MDGGAFGSCIPAPPVPGLPPQVIRRRFSRRLPDEPPLCHVSRAHIVQAVARQLHVRLPPQVLAMSKAGGIKEYGVYKVG